MFVQYLGEGLFARRDTLEWLCGMEYWRGVFRTSHGQKGCEVMFLQVRERKQGKDVRLAGIGFVENRKYEFIGHYFRESESIELHFREVGNAETTWLFRGFIDDSVISGPVSVDGVSCGKGVMRPMDVEELRRYATKRHALYVFGKTVAEIRSECYSPLQSMARLADLARIDELLKNGWGRGRVSLLKRVDVNGVITWTGNP